MVSMPIWSRRPNMNLKKKSKITNASDMRVNIMFLPECNFEFFPNRRSAPPSRPAPLVGSGWASQRLWGALGVARDLVSLLDRSSRNARASVFGPTCWQTRKKSLSWAKLISVC